jgi:hypothetical protein
MSAAEDDADPPLTVDLLADLQAGLLDDDAAARVRTRVGDDPQAAATLQALQQVRRDVAHAGAAHAARPPIRPARVIAGIVGLGAVLAAIAVGTMALLNESPSAPSVGPTANHISVSTPAPVIPLSDAEILGLLRRPPDFGPLSRASQRASCLAGLGYPTSVAVLGAQPVEINARAGVLLLVPGDTPDMVTAYAVAVNCSAADTGLLATTAIAR